MSAEKFKVKKGGSYLKNRSLYYYRTILKW